MEIRIPVYQPFMHGNEKKYVNECIDTSWISSKGNFINKFEAGFAKYINVKHALSVSNGTVAIHLALLALDIKQGDEILVPTFTYIATANAIAHANATPVFIDADPNTWQIDPTKIESKITKNTKGIIITHLYGHACEMDMLVSICKKHNIFLVEDCAEATGTFYKGKHVGGYGHISTFSFYGNKTITTGEGGIVATNDQTLADKMYLLKMQGVSPTKQYWHDVIGYNYKMTNICAALGLAQLEQVDIILDKKRQVANWYINIFEKNNVAYHKPAADVLSSWWMFSILATTIELRNELRAHLQSKGIETRPTFYPVHHMPMYKTEKLSLPVSEDLGLRGINLPSYPALRQTEVEEIANTVCSFLKSKQAI